MNSGDPRSNELQQSLTRLHSTLSASPAVDEGSRNALRNLLGDIDRLLKEPGVAAPAQDSPPAAAAHSSRLEQLAVNFDSAHPTLSGAVRELVELLGRAGL
jgi:hypothetical protein